MSDIKLYGYCNVIFAFNASHHVYKHSSLKKFNFEKQTRFNTPKSLLSLRMDAQRIGSSG
jgi:hypothetical protein